VSISNGTRIPKPNGGGIMNFKDLKAQMYARREQARVEARKKHELKHAFSPVECCTLDGRKLLVSFDRFTRTYHVGIDGWVSDETHLCADDAIKALQDLVDMNFVQFSEVPEDFKCKMVMMEETNG
jgi:hypothetical protein